MIWGMIETHRRMIAEAHQWLRGMIAEAHQWLRGPAGAGGARTHRCADARKRRRTDAQTYWLSGAAMHAKSIHPRCSSSHLFAQLTHGSTSFLATRRGIDPHIISASLVERLSHYTNLHLLLLR